MTIRKNFAQSSRKDFFSEMVKVESYIPISKTIQAGVEAFPVDGFNLAGRSRKALKIAATTQVTVKIQERDATDEAWHTIMDPLADEDLSFTVGANGTQYIPCDYAGVFFRLNITAAADSIVTVSAVGGP